jgi:predicted nucleic acid-binding protein
MSRRYALDTNIISFIMRGDKQVVDTYHQMSDRGDTFVIPIAVYYEVRRGLLATGATAKMKSFERLCWWFDVEEMGIDEWEKAAQIHASLRKRGTPLGRDDGDIFIAAQCIINGYTLVTDNTGDFERVDELKTVNWK